MNKMKKNHNNWLRSKEVIQSKNSQKMHQKLKTCNLKIHKGGRIWKKPKKFLNKGTKHKKN